MEGAEVLHKLILAAVCAQRHASLMTPIIPMILKMIHRWILVGTKNAGVVLQRAGTATYPHLSRSVFSRLMSLPAVFTFT
jgi:hypothetical protein